MIANNKILITTIQPVGGGVPTMLRFVTSHLKALGYEITLAYYEPFSVSPQLSVPLHKLFTKKPSIRFDSYLGTNCVGVGCRLPELEFCHHWLSPRWQALIDGHDLHLMISGSVLAAHPYLQSNTPFMAWAATDWEGDRAQRANNYPWYRKIIDKVIVAPLAKGIEKRIVNTGRVVSLSRHTARELNQGLISGRAQDVLHMPVDVDRFVPKPRQEFAFKLGLVARFEDPRKHVSLLLRSFAALIDTCGQAELILVGDQLSPKSRDLIEQLGIAERVSVIEYIEDDDLPSLLQSLDVFVLPSHQEGLCIAALEAMSCGVPVVSTKCGGPEDYIRHGENGLLCEPLPEEMAKSILQLFANISDYRRYSKAAREMVVTQFSPNSQKQRFNHLLEKHLGDSLSFVKTND